MTDCAINDGKDDVATSALLANELAAHGFDICHPFFPAWYNDLLVSEDLQSSLSPLPDDDDEDEDEDEGDHHHDAFLIGNTKALWPQFLAWLRDRQTPNNEEAIRIPEHPVDLYARETIETVLERVFKHRLGRHCLGDDGEGDDGRRDYEIFWSEGTCPSRLVCLSRVAKASGFACIDPATKLCIHPIYGAWTSFRAVVVVRQPKFSQPHKAPPRPPPPPPIQYLLSEREEVAARNAMKKALHASDEKNLCKQLGGGEGMLEDNLYEHWIAMRDCVGVGRDEYRFSHGQLMYHYTKDLKFLEEDLQTHIAGDSVG
jgi:hypothetical protein